MANRPITACVFQHAVPRPWRTSRVSDVPAVFIKRKYSDYAISTRDGVDKSKIPPSKVVSNAANPYTASGLQRLPTLSLLRNYFMGLMFTRPLLFNAAFNILQRVANSRLAIMNPDRNPLLRAVVKPLIYDQFCAGTNQKEIFRTRDVIKKTGYSGIILCYGKEIQPSTAKAEVRTGKVSESVQVDELKQWLDGNLETLEMMGEGDWLGIKLTGTGVQTTAALVQNEPAPASFISAMDQICDKARSKNCRIWIDAEQQEFQASIDRWTIDMMRKHNRDVKPGQNALVYNTLQAYLKASRSKLRHQLQLAKEEGWTLAIKLVRGAYIATDIRERIHDTKQETDESYNGIVKDLLSGSSSLGFAGPEEFPDVRLFLAGHNPESVDRAWDLVQSLAKEGNLNVLPDFGQLQGMADELGCKVLAKCDAVAGRGEGSQEEGESAKVVPKIYKCLTWGTIQECMQYLIRRIVENRGGADRMRDGLGAYRVEIKRRMFGARGQST